MNIAFTYCSFYLSKEKPLKKEIFDEYFLLRSVHVDYVHAKSRVNVV